MERIPYPSNYFDPFGHEPTRAQCEECGEWKDMSDMEDLHEVNNIVGYIWQGTCVACKERIDSDAQENQDGSDGPTA